MATNRRRRREAPEARDPSLLARLLFDDDGKRFTPSHAVKNGRRYRYYIHRSPLVDADSQTIEEAPPKATRIAAREIERHVLTQLCRFLNDPSHLLDTLSGMEATGVEQAIRAGAKLARDLETASGTRQRQILTNLVRRIVLGADTLQIEISSAGLIDLLGLAKGDPKTSSIHEGAHQIIHPMTLRRRGVELKLVIEGTAQRHTKLDPSLIKVIARAHAWMDHLTSGRLRTVKELAENQDLTGSYVTRVMRLAFLAPDIVEAILQGKQPPDLTAQTLLRGIELPPSWQEQRTRLGFPTA